MNDQAGDPLNTLEILIAQLHSMWEGIVSLLPSLVIAILFLLLTWIVARFATKIADRLTAKTTMRPSLRELVDTLVRIAIWTVGLLIALTILLPDLTPGSLIAGLGVGTVAIGFAFQDIFENFLAGILIMIREKMRIGDYISCEGIEGRVEQIMLRETHIRKMSNELTIVPNSILFKNPVEILTDEQQRRHEIVVGVSYDTDLPLQPRMSPMTRSPSTYSPANSIPVRSISNCAGGRDRPSGTCTKAAMPSSGRSSVRSTRPESKSPSPTGRTRSRKRYRWRPPAIDAIFLTDISV